MNIFYHSRFCLGRMLMIIAFIFILFSVVIKAQKSPVITDSTSFTASTNSATIELGRNEFLVQVWLDADISGTVKFQQYAEDKLKWFWIHDERLDQIYVVTVDSTLDNVIPLPALKFYAGKNIRAVISNSQTYNMRYEKRPY